MAFLSHLIDLFVTVWIYLLHIIVNNFIIFYIIYLFKTILPFIDNSLFLFLSVLSVMHEI